MKEIVERQKELEEGRNDVERTCILFSNSEIRPSCGITSSHVACITHCFSLNDKYIN
jgi:hypothetical protein